MPDKSHYFSKSQLYQYRQIVAKHPPLQRLHKLYVDYAREQGGITLDVWRVMRGHWFGEPQRMGVEGAAEALDLPVSDVLSVRDQTHAALAPAVRKLQPELRRVGREIDAYARKHLPE